MAETGSRDLKIWLADGTNYAGQGDMRARQDWLAEGLAQIYARLGDEARVLLEMSQDYLLANNWTWRCCAKMATNIQIYCSNSLNLCN